jgi:thioredoxin 1
VIRTAEEESMTDNLLTIDDTNFDSEIGKGVALLDFYATWCGPCKTIAPLIEQLADEFADKGVKVGKVDIEQAQALAVKYSIQGVPTLLFFKDGEVVDRMTGAHPKPSIEEKLSSISG